MQDVLIVGAGPTGLVELSNWCAARGISLQQFSWAPERQRSGLTRNAAYLLRPDSYIGIVDPQGNVASIERYLEARGLNLRVSAS